MQYMERSSGIKQNIIFAASCLLSVISSISYKANELLYQRVQWDKE